MNYEYIGKRLHRLNYYGGKREIESKTIVKETPTKVKLSWYKNYWLKKENICHDWFLSKEYMVESKIANHRDWLTQFPDDEGCREELKSLIQYLKRIRKANTEGAKR